MKESISKNCRITRLDLDPLPRNKYAAVRHYFNIIIIILKHFKFVALTEVLKIMYLLDLGSNKRVHTFTREDQTNMH